MKVRTDPAARQRPAATPAAPAAPATPAAPAERSAGVRTTSPPAALAGALKDALAAAAQAGVRIEVLDEGPRMHRAAAVIDQVWQMDAGHRLLEPNLLRALEHSGNYVAAAFAGTEMIAACVGFLGFDSDGGLLLHSHVAGVLPGRVGRGVGRAMKLHQRAWCLRRGVPTVTWTYDPLIARNAYLNLQVLGARVDEYLIDFYGDMADAINAGDRSDRVLARWQLATPMPGTVEIDPAVPAVLDVDHAGVPIAGVPATGQRCRVAIPHDIEALRHSDPALAGQWRTAVGDVLPTLLADGWTVVGFDRSGYYELERR